MSFLLSSSIYGEQNSLGIALNTIVLQVGLLAYINWQLAHIVINRTNFNCTSCPYLDSHVPSLFVHYHWQQGPHSCTQYSSRSHIFYEEVDQSGGTCSERCLSPSGSCHKRGLYVMGPAGENSEWSRLHSNVHTFDREVSSDTCSYPGIGGEWPCYCASCYGAKYSLIFGMRIAAASRDRTCGA